jgi:hypothetical protein
MNGSFENEKQLIFTFTLGASTFGKTGGNTLIVQGLRGMADIEHAGGMVMSTAKVRVFGLNEETMQQLTMLAWLSMGVTKNTLLIEAQDGDQVTAVFSGQILNSWPDYQSMPDVFLYAECQAGFYEQVTPATPSSYKGTVDVARIMSDLASKMSLNFENQGVSVKLSNPYLPDSLLEQVKAVAEAANINYFLDIDTLAIWPKGKDRESIQPLISPATGLIGYPIFDKVGVTFNTYFNPALKFGGTCKIETDVKPAAGVWRVTGLSHSLSTRQPNGKWMSQVRCTESGLVPTK